MSVSDLATSGTPKFFKGIPVNAGKVSGKVCLFSIGRQKHIPEYSLQSDAAVQEELRRFNMARLLCSEELTRIAAEVEVSVGKAEAEIFTTQQHIMSDPKVIDAIGVLITSERKNAEWAINKVLVGFEEMMASLDNQYLRERSSDLSEIRRRLLSRLVKTRTGFLCEGQSHCRHGADRLIAAEELTPDMIVNMKMDRVLGFITEHGGITSHAAILARSLGIPAVSGIAGLLDHVACGDTVFINGDTGEACVNPDEATLAELTRPASDECEEKERGDVAALPVDMELSANASTIEDVRLAKFLNADGIGLFRTEIAFVGAERLLSEDEQYGFYREVIDAMPDRPFTFRMLDIGGDKPLPFLRLRKEANPFLGYRGSRFLLGNPDIFNSQIRALGRLSLQRRIRILFPMVIDAAQMQLLLDRSREALAGTGHDDANIQFGAMFEVPSAFIQSREILKKIDFASIGSNDLIQYLFAVDRDNELLSSEYNPEHPALWIFLKELAVVAHEAGKPLSICGEMAGREGIPRKLLAENIRSLSVAPRLIPRVRHEMVRFVRSASQPGK